VILIIKTCAFSWNNNCIIVNMHGKTTIKIITLQTEGFAVGVFERGDFI
jgi:hypothetical protein